MVEVSDLELMVFDLSFAVGLSTVILDLVFTAVAVTDLLSSIVEFSLFVVAEHFELGIEL